jgi:PmbA protein
VITKNPKEYCELAFDIIAKTKKLGATATEVAYDAVNGFAVNIRNNEIDTVEHNNGKNLELTVYFGDRTGSASTTDLSPQAIQNIIEKACYIAKFTTPDPFAGLADSSLMAYDYQDLDLYHSWPIDIKEAINLAKNAEKKGLAYDKKIINSEGFAIDSFNNLEIYANSHGFCGQVLSTKHGLSCSLIAEDKNNMQRDYYYTVARDFKDLETADQVALTAAKRTRDRLNARKISTRTCPVIFNAETARTLISSFIHALNGNNIYRKTSFLLASIQKKILPEYINIIENPLIPKALGSATFDAEGVKLSHNNIVLNGVLQRYILDSYAARKLNMQTTGNAGGVHNLIINTSDLNFNELLRKMDKGLLITELMGDGINIVTGDYSRGAFGYWVENGLIQYPVTGITIAGNLKDMLLNIVAISNDIDYRSNILTGSILLDKMTIAGN